MGEVYAARDTRLDRRVAIKISKAQFTERFEREARAAAALNHPHICQLYDVGPNYLVMEYVDGSPIWLVANDRQLLACAIQIADGLAAAHAVGIVHRDIKPSNLLITSTGQVKILDFGLATLAPTTIAASADTVTVRREAPVTATWAVVGTAAYMSPEHARGEAVDARTDLWSLGVVLYELATGKRPFDGPTSAVIFQELLSNTPTPVRERNPKIHADFERVIDRLLEKDRETRYQSAADVRADLKRISRDSTDGHPVTRTSGTALSGSERDQKTILAAGTAAAAVVLAAVIWLLSRLGGGPVTSPSEYVQLTDFADSVVEPSLSPDGRMVTFLRSDSAGFPRRGNVYVKLLPNGDALRLTNSDDLRYGPVFTPDGSRVAYTQLSRASAGRVTWDTWTVPLGGGEPTLMLPNAAGLVWTDDRHVLFSEIKGTGLHMGIVTSTAGRSDKREIYYPDHERAMAHYSYPSPDRRWLLISEMDRTNVFQPCRLTPFDGSSPGKQVGPRGMCAAAAWTPDGRWMYFSVDVNGASHLWRQRFPDGQPEQVTFGLAGESGIAMAADGRAVVTAVGQERSAIWMHDEKGERQVTTEGVAFNPVLSIDGRRLYYLLRQSSMQSSVTELRSFELSTGKTDRLLPDRSVTQYSISPDEREVAFTTVTPEGMSEIWIAVLDRSGPPRRLVQGGDEVAFGGPSDLYYRSLEDKANFLMRIRKDASHRQRVIESPVLNLLDVSPDGEWAAVRVSGTGVNATPVMLAVPLRGGTPKTMCPGGCVPSWDPTGKWLYIASTGIQKSTGLLAVPLVPGQAPPDSLVSIIEGAANSTLPPGVRVLEHNLIAPGPDPSIYAFTKRDLQRNLYRIPLH